MYSDTIQYKAILICKYLNLPPFQVTDRTIDSKSLPLNITGFSLPLRMEDGSVSPTISVGIRPWLSKIQRNSLG